MGISADLKTRIQNLDDEALQKGIEVLASVLEDLGESFVEQYIFMKSELRYRKFSKKLKAKKSED